MFVKNSYEHTNGRCDFMLHGLVTIVSLYIFLCDKGMCDNADGTNPRHAEQEKQAS